MSSKVDLTTLRRLMSELETTLKTAESIETAVSPDNKLEFIVEMNKATGLASGVLLEASMLMGDIQQVIQNANVPGYKSNFLDKLLGNLKGPGNAN